MENNPTVLSVILVRFLIWFQNSSWHRVKRATVRLGCVIAVVVGVAAPQFLLGLLAACIAFHEFLVLKAGTILLAMFYGRAIARAYRRIVARIRTANQKTFYDIPVDELATYLLDSGRFTRDDAMLRLGISQPKHKKISDALYQGGILERGEFNAMQLRPIGRAQLVGKLVEMSSPRARRAGGGEGDSTEQLDTLARSPFAVRLIKADAAL